MDKAHRDSLIRANFKSGISPAMIAVSFKLSVRQVYRILKAGGCL